MYDQTNETENALRKSEKSRMKISFIKYNGIKSEDVRTYDSINKM